MNLDIQKARQKFGKIDLKPHNNKKSKRKCAEEFFSAPLPILYDSYRHKNWVKRLKQIIYSDSGGLI